MDARRLFRVFVLVKFATALLALMSSKYFHPYLNNTELLLSSEASAGPLDEAVRSVLAPFARWDALYFLQIATNGYQYEHQHAFFPLFPLLIRFGALGLHKAVGLSMMSGALLTGVAISNICHLFFAANIYKYLVWLMRTLT